eukprot:5273493-Pyramimonas_sp.AAC.1
MLPETRLAVCETDALVETYVPLLGERLSGRRAHIIVVCTWWSHGVVNVKPLEPKMANNDSEESTRPVPSDLGGDGGECGDECDEGRDDQEWEDGPEDLSWPRPAPLRITSRIQPTRGR